MHGSGGSARQLVSRSGALELSRREGDPAQMNRSKSSYPLRAAKLSSSARLVSIDSRDRLSFAPALLISLTLTHIRERTLHVSPALWERGLPYAQGKETSSSFSPFAQLHLPYLSSSLEIGKLDLASDRGARRADEAMSGGKKIFNRGNRD